MNDIDENYYLSWSLYSRGRGGKTEGRGGERKGMRKRRREKEKGREVEAERKQIG